MIVSETNLSARLKNHITVYDILRPIYYCSLPIGLTQFSVKEKKFKSCNLFIPWSIVCFFAFATAGLYMLNARVLTERITAMYVIADLMYGWVNIINFSAIIIFGCIFKNKILKILEDLHTLDEELTFPGFAYKISKVYKRMKVYVIIATVLISLIICVVIILEEITYCPRPVKIVRQFSDISTYCLPLIYTSYMLLQFCTILAFIKQHYFWINQQLENIAALCSEQLLYKKDKIKICNGTIFLFSDETFIESIVHAVRTLQRKHKLLTTISYSLNTAYSLQILTTIIEILFTLLAIMFFWAYKQIRNDWGTEVIYRETYVYYANALVLLHAGQLIALVLFCSRTMKEANKSGYLIHRIYYPSHLIDSQLLHFSGQLLHNKLIFTACNLFEIDGTLLCSLVSTITTYMVIVIQFEMAA